MARGARGVAWELALFSKGLALCASCSSSTGSSTGLPSPDEPIPGFNQTIATTECGLGSGVHVKHLPGDTQWIGSEGLFDVDLANQSSFCLTNPLRDLKGPDASVETTAVKTYFTGAGMPASQIGASTPSYAHDSSGEEYVSIKLSRVIGATPVAESYAFASLLAGQSLAEGVYWPALPASVSEELAKLQAIVGNAKSLAAFQAKLPASFVTGSIVIHHSDEDARVPGHPAEEITLIAHACYDALIAEGEEGITECFLPDGTMFTFPTSRGSAQSNGKGKARAGPPSVR